MERRSWVDRHGAAHTADEPCPDPFHPPDQEARAERCPTCGSDDPDTCRLNHHHHPWTVVPRAVGRKYCCPDSFHAPPERCPECKAEWIGGYRVHEEGCFYGEQEADVSPIAPDQEARAEKCGGSGEVPVTLYGDEYPETGFRTTDLCPGCPDCTATPPDQGPDSGGWRAVADDFQRAMFRERTRIEQLERDLATAERQREEANEELLMTRIRAGKAEDKAVNERSRRILNAHKLAERAEQAEEQAEGARQVALSQAKRAEKAEAERDQARRGLGRQRTRAQRAEAAESRRSHQLTETRAERDDYAVKAANSMNSLATLRKQVAEHVEWAEDCERGAFRQATGTDDPGLRGRQIARSGAYLRAADNARQILEEGE